MKSNVGPKRLLVAILCLPLTLQSFGADLSPLELGKKLRVAADAGDADSMFLLAIVLMKYAPEPERPYKICDGKLVNPLIKQDTTGKDCRTVQNPDNKKLLEQWSTIGTKYDVEGWITKAAEGGNRQAIGIKCDMGSDPSAPAELCENAELWCARL